jgi:hypothetical protein
MPQDIGEIITVVCKGFTVIGGIHGRAAQIRLGQIIRRLQHQMTKLFVFQWRELVSGYGTHSNYGIGHALSRSGRVKNRLPSINIGDIRQGVSESDNFNKLSLTRPLSILRPFCLTLQLLSTWNLDCYPKRNKGAYGLHPSRINHEPARRFPQPAKITHKAALPINRDAVLGMAVSTDQRLDITHRIKSGKRLLFLLHKAVGTRKAIVIAQLQPPYAECLDSFRRCSVVFHPRHQVSMNPRTLHFGAPL